MKKGTYLMRKVAGVTAVAMLLSLGIPADVNAAEAVTVDNTYAVISSVATPGDADGAYLSKDGYYYYYQNGSILKKSGWLKLESGEAVKLDSSYRIIYRQELDGSKKIISRYDAAGKEFVAYEKDVIELSDGKLYFAGAKGVISTASKTISDGKGNTYIRTSGGVVTGKLVRKGTAIYCYTYSKSGHKWVQVKKAYKTVDNKRYYFRSSDGKAMKMYDIAARKLYKYSNSKMVLVKSGISTVDSNRIYLFNSKGIKLTTSGWYTLKSGDRVLVGKNGYVTAKLTKKGETRRYYTYDYRSNAWKQKKSQWITVGNTQYYFAANGVAKYSYNTKTSKLYQYSNGRFAAAKKAAVKLGNGKIYYFGSNAAKVTKAGWYTVNSTDKLQINSKGYVTMKLSTRSRKLLKYDYSKNSWVTVRVSTYKIGSTTYYFNSKGLIARNEIAGDSRSGYFYVDSTGCKVTSLEIQMAVNFVVRNTTDNMSREQKLRACYNKLSTFPYQRDYTKPSYEGRFRELAIEALSNGTANCYRYASAFACVATVLGYDARVTCGLIPPWYNGELTMHGWAELWDPSLKEWRVYDPCKQRNAVNESFYNRDIRTFYPGSLVIERRVRLTVKNGYDSWDWIN